LEFLGDAILSGVVADLLYQKHPDAQEGELTRRRAHIVNKPSLVWVANQLSLGDYIELGQGEQCNGGYKKASILATTVEALLASVYLDGGWDVAYQVIDRLFAELLSADCREKDAKTRLQELLQAQRLPLPVYELVTLNAQDTQGQFVVRCQVTGLQQTLVAQSNTRRKAEQQAASLALKLLESHAG
jgi:ribonuclease-3